MPDQNINKLDFENAYQELEAIVENMERGEQNLEKSLTDFERGVSLMKHYVNMLISFTVNAG